MQPFYFQLNGVGRKLLVCEEKEDFKSAGITNSVE